jgi:extracellular elastinolytic metalloproteinase
VSREYDLREEAPALATGVTIDDLQEVAEAVSANLEGDHAVVVDSIDEVTGRPSAILSENANPASDEDLVRVAHEHLDNLGPLFGFAAPEELSGYRMDPTPVRTSSGAAVVHARQEVAGIVVFQASRTVRFDRDGVLRATVGTTEPVAEVPNAEPELERFDAIRIATEYVARPDDDDRALRDPLGEPIVSTDVDLDPRDLELTVASEDKDTPERRALVDALGVEQPIATQLRWFPLPNGLRLAWEVIVVLPSFEQWRVLVDARDGRRLYVHQLNSSVAATADVFFPSPDAAITGVQLPLDVAAYPVAPPTVPPASPQFAIGDWVATNHTEGNSVTCGFGVDAQLVQGQQGPRGLLFAAANADQDDQLVINAFFLCNYMHDVLYGFGFREAEGNFQMVNESGFTGANDRVLARAIPAVLNQVAVMSTPIDGVSPTMTMGRYGKTTRHSALDASVIFHEYTHGMSNRLVGGLSDDTALDAVQSKSMGEGWSDYVACTLTATDVVGAWLTTDSTKGIRTHRYRDYPGSFASLKGREPHSNGELWCAALLRLNQRIGTPLALQMVIDGMKKLPASPTYLLGRDMILEALADRQAIDRATDEEHDRELVGAWEAFADYGMGWGAAIGPANSFNGIRPSTDLPPQLQGH